MESLHEVYLAIPGHDHIPLGAFEDLQKPVGITGRIFQIDGPGSWRRRSAQHPLGPKQLRHTGYRRNRIQEDLRLQWTGVGMRVVQPVPPIVEVGSTAKLVGPGRNNPPHQMLQVIAVLLKVLSQPVQQTRMGRRVSQTKVVDWIHNPSSEEMTPHPVNHGFRKVGMSRHPVGQLLPEVAPVPAGEHSTIEKGRWHQLLGARMAILSEGQRALTLSEIHLVSVGVVKDNVVKCPFGIRHTAVETPQSPELILLPTVIGVVMALSAIHPSAHENPKLLGHDPFQSRGLVIVNQVDS